LSAREDLTPLLRIDNSGGHFNSFARPISRRCGRLFVCHVIVFADSEVLATGAESRAAAHSKRANGEYKGLRPQ
jgi:hypothetical protein